MKLQDPTKIHQVPDVSANTSRFEPSRMARFIIPSILEVRKSARTQLMTLLEKIIQAEKLLAEVCLDRNLMLNTIKERRLR